MLGGEEFLEQIKNETHPAYRHAYNGTLLGSNLLSMAPLATSMALKAPKYLKTGYSVLRNWRTHMVLAKQTCQQTPAFIKYALGIGRKASTIGSLEGRVSFVSNRGVPKRLDLEALSRAGQVMDRGGLTKAGRALDKHGGRSSSIFPKATGNITTKNIQREFEIRG